MKQIEIRGARQHNLKGVDLSIPRQRLVVITGLSGSGKSSLAFDTIYAEGQRRYVESLSVYARQFLERLAKPEVELLEGLSPAISIEQRPLSKNPRSTVGTVTEIYDYLRLLFARVGQPHCPGCGMRLTALSSQQIIDRVLGLPEGTRLAVLAPLIRGQRGAFADELARLRREGYVRATVDGQVIELAEELELDPAQAHEIDVHVDRLVIRDGIRGRLGDSLELALKLADGVVKVAQVQGETQLYTERLACIDCGLGLTELSPRAFSFNSPHGACERCSGLGELLEFDEERLVPDPARSLREGAIEPLAQRNAAHHQQQLEALASHFGFDLYVPYGELPAAVRELLMRGSGEEEIKFHYQKGGRRASYRQPFEGVIPQLERRLGQQRRKRKEGGAASAAEATDDAINELRRYMLQRVCPDCGGARLRREALHVLLQQRNIHQLSGLTIGQALEFFDGLQLQGQQHEVGQRLVQEIRARLSFLDGVGLDYLSLHRPTATLSGGEGQRVRLATQIGAALVGVLYILDEPSVGLHKRDHQRLLQTLLRLRDAGNSVLVVEHDEETIRAADFIVDMGPGAGTEGGQVVVAGDLAQVEACPRSLTGQYLTGARSIERPRQRRRSARALLLRGARQNNLQRLDVSFPLGLLVCVTGVSGSGKSTLVMDTLLPALRQRIHGARDSGGLHDGIEGAALLDKVVSVDQSPIGRTPRSNPATYSGVLTRIRELFAGLPESKLRGYKAGRYSFNVKGGRCEACQGDGILRIAMHFLPDVYVRCEVCGGQRYNSETLQVRYKGLNIAQMLELTISEACELLAAVPAVAQRLRTMAEVGLGYLKLGQPANTLSGGEAQRLKLSRELARQSTGRTLYILDEPTTGLHLADIHLLLDAVNGLVDAGNTVLVIEHHLDVIKCADHVIDLGPEGGDGGGRLVACGTPEEVAAVTGSFTGQYLRRVLG